MCCAYDREQTNGTTPLVGASLKGHVEVVRALVAASAAVNQADVCLRALWSMLRLLVFKSVVRAPSVGPWWCELPAGVVPDARLVYCEMSRLG